MLDIIIANSDEETRNLFYKTFTDLGYMATTTITHREILDLLNRERPSYIILDSSISDIPAESMIKKIALVDENIKVITAPRDKAALVFSEEMIKIIITRQFVVTSSQEENKNLSLKTKVMVVDDEEASTELIKNYLTRKGYNVNTAKSGEDAISKIKSERPDVVFLDIYMTGMDGMLVLKNIKDIDNTIIVIMTSANDDREIIKQSIELGANGYLIKPFNLQKLEEIILSNANA